MSQAQHDIAKKLRILNYAKQLGTSLKPVATSASPEKLFTSGNVLMNRKANHLSLTASLAHKTQSYECLFSSKRRFFISDALITSA